MPRWLADTVARRLGVRQLSIDTSHSPVGQPRTGRTVGARHHDHTGRTAPN
jgi:hypothetical protein